jgi:transcription initiation factor TFIID subunit 5
VSPHAWEESTGLLSSLIPQTNGSKTSLTNPQAFNTAALKLGPAPIAEDLRTEAERVLREQAMMERDVNAQYELPISRPLVAPGLTAPTDADLLPHPPTFKMADVEREVAMVRDARKRIRLEPSVLTNVDPNSPQASALRARALPSICAYTLHDVAEG